MLALVLVIREASTDQVAPRATTFTLAPAEEDGKAKPLSNNEENKREANTAYSEFDQHDYDYRQFVVLGH